MVLKKMLQIIKQEQGALVVLTALLLPVIFGFTGLAVDIGNLHVHKARLQNTADAAVLAGGKAYLDNLRQKKESATDKSVTLSTDEVMEVRANLVRVADEYIVKNNPLFNDKLSAGQGNNSKSYAIGKKTNTEDSNKSTEYFRVSLTETVPVHFLPVLGIQNVADVSVYATAKITDTEVKVINNSESGGTTPHDGGEDPLVVAGTSFESKNADKKNSNTYDFKLYVTGDTQDIQAKKIGTKYYVRSSNGQYMEIDQSKKYNMDTFGEEMRKLFRQLRADRDPESTDEYYMTYHGTSGNAIDFKNFADISQNPAKYGMNENEHSYVYLSYANLSHDIYDDTIENFNIGNLYTGTLPSGKVITENTPYYILVEKDLRIKHLEIQASCTRPVVFCYLRESDEEEVKFEFHNNKYGVSKSIYYAPHVSTWVQINTNNSFIGSIVGDKVRFGLNKSNFRYDIEEISKWMEGEDGLKFLPSVGFYEEPDNSSSGSSSGSGGTTVIKEEITLPDGHLQLVLAGSQTDASYYKNSDIKWDDLDE